MSRILLFHFDGLFPPAHGSARYGRRLMEVLAGQGHDCTVVSLYRSTGDRVVVGQDLACIPATAEVATREDGEVAFRHRGVLYRGVTWGSGRLAAFIWRVLREQPFDVVIVGDEYRDGAVLALRECRDLRGTRVLYAVHTVHNLPVGPQSMNVSEALALMIRTVDGILTTSRFAASYVSQYLPRPVVTLPPEAPPPAASLQVPEPLAGMLTFINPSIWKGIDLFEQIARQLPHRSFLAVAGWGTTADDRTRLAVLGNVTLIEWQHDIGAVFGRTSILLVPSVWQENFGMVAIEAMAAGIPVLASDQGGLSEALCAVTAPIPVRPLEISGSPPRAVSPPQDPTPWIAEIERLLENPGEYKLLARRAVEAAGEFRLRNDWERMDLEQVLWGPRSAH